MLTPTFGKHKSLTVFFSDAQNFAYRIVEVILNNDPCNITENLQSLISSNPGVHKPQMPGPLDY